MSKIKAVLFDMDGVLIDAKDWHYEALNRALNLFSYNISREEHLTTFDGLPTRVKLNMLSEKSSLPYGLHDFINEMKQEYTYELVHQFCKPKFEQERALSKLKSEGYLLAVASNSIRCSVSLMMNKSKLEKYLDFQASNEDVAKPKPHPDIYLYCMERFKLKPTECVVVEDNENGIRAARASGAHVLVVNSVEDVNYRNIRAFINKVEEEA